MIIWTVVFLHISTVDLEDSKMKGFSELLLVVMLLQVLLISFLKNCRNRSGNKDPKYPCWKEVLVDIWMFPMFLQTFIYCLFVCLCWTRCYYYFYVFFYVLLLYIYTFFHAFLWWTFDLILYLLRTIIMYMHDIILWLVF